MEETPFLGKCGKGGSFREVGTMPDEEKKEKSFVVRDRRKFTETGEDRDEASGKPEEAPAGTSGRAEEVQEKKRRDPGEEETALPEMNFAHFIFSLSTSAMYHFGDFPDPVSNKAERNLAAARQTIDIIAMLKEKTEGNLSADEKTLIDTILFELRMRYVKEKEKG
jgi:hypothetical protein